MKEFFQVLLTALAAVTVENVLFSGGIGFSRVLRAARKHSTIGLYSLFVTLFSLVSVLLACAFGPELTHDETFGYLRPVLFALFAGAAYLAVTFVIKTFFPLFYEKHWEILPPAAINTVVLSMPYVQKSFKLAWPQAVGFALGTGFAFFLAACILARAAIRCRNEDMPRSFSGLPAMLLYIGILSLAFAGFSGGKLF